MAKVRIVLNKSPRKQAKHNPWGDIFTDCPPETPYQLFINAAIDAMGQKHGDAVNELSEGIAELMLDVAVTAAIAALEAARVSNDWRDMVKPKQPVTSEECHHDTAKSPPSWTYAVIQSPVHLYRELAWMAQNNEHPELLCKCLGLTEAQKIKVIGIVDYLIEFALTAAGVDEAWDELYQATLTKMEAG